jgi:hypothetical protein
MEVSQADYHGDINKSLKAHRLSRSYTRGVWLRQMHKIITEQCEFAQDSKPTVIFEDNAACVAQVGAGFIKTNRTKHICPEIFGFTQELIQSGQIEVKKIESAHNLADMLTKALPAHTHRKLVQGAGMKLLHELLY